MNVFLIILLVAAMIATLVALVRGLVVFLSSATAEAHRDQATGPSPAAIKSNKMMQYRIFFQATAIAIVVLLLVLAGKN